MLTNSRASALIHRMEDHPDWKHVVRLGGPTKVAALLNFPKKGGRERVSMWRHRGIPDAMKLEHPDLFLVAREKAKLVKLLQK